MARTKRIVVKIQNEIKFLTKGLVNYPESYNMYCIMIKDIRATISGLYYMDILSQSEFHELCEFFDETVYPYFDGAKE